MRRSRRGLRWLIGGGLTGAGALLALGACLEAPSLDECYSARDCPTAMACTAGVCGVPVPSTDGGFVDGPRLDMLADTTPPDVTTPTDVTVPVPDAGQPAAVRCEALREDDGTLIYDIIHERESDAAVYVDAVHVDGRIAVVWQGPEPTHTRVACHTPGGATSEPYLYEGRPIDAGRPSIARQPDRLVAAWAGVAGANTQVEVQAFDLDCGEALASGALGAEGFADVQLAASRERLQVAARVGVGDDTGLGGLYYSELGRRLELAAAIPADELTLRSFALSDDGFGPVFALAGPHDAGGVVYDGVIAFRYNLFDARLTLSGVGITRAHIDGMLPIGGSAFVIGWSATDATGAVTRRLTEVTLDEVDPRIWAQKNYGTGAGRLDTPPDLAYDLDLARTVVVTADEGLVQFRSLAPRDLQTPLVTLDIAPGENPAVVVLDRGEYGVLYSTHLDGQTYLKLARVTCTALEPR